MSHDPNVPMGGGGDNSGRTPRRSGCGTIIGLIVIVVILGNIMNGCTDDSNGSGGGGFFFLPFFGGGSSSSGSNYGDGSGFRGGGPGTGK